MRNEIRTVWFRPLCICLTFLSVFFVLIMYCMWSHVTSSANGQLYIIKINKKSKTRWSLYNQPFTYITTSHTSSQSLTLTRSCHMWLSHLPAALLSRITIMSSWYMLYYSYAVVVVTTFCVNLDKISSSTGCSIDIVFFLKLLWFF